jgi:histidine ammonia-lyase/tyrosine ammonia-lyase
MLHLPHPLPQALTLETLVAVARGGETVALSNAAALDQRRRDFLALKQPIYGVNTGFGELVHHRVSEADGQALQHNLIRSHCAAVGALCPADSVRAMMLSRAQVLAQGYSAVRSVVVERLLEYLNRGLVPAVPAISSLGASGDLGTLAAIAITLIGEGYFLENQQPVPAATVLAREGLSPLVLEAKEGLALINGTSGMCGLGGLALWDLERQTVRAERIAALSLQALGASTGPFWAEGHALKAHAGQVASAAHLRTLLAGSGLSVSHEQLAERLAEDEAEVFLQKAYSLRCIPQVLGAVRDTSAHARRVLETELNSIHDNPIFLPDNRLFHGGHFHGQPVAFVMDYAAIAATQLGVIGERRLHRLLSPRLNQNRLPEFLAVQAGLHCGFAGAQYPATATVAENRTLCSPASIHSVPSNGDNQDVVSFGLLSARRLAQIVENNWTILAIEYLAAAQAIDLLKVAGQLSPESQKDYQALRDHVPMLTGDRYLSDEIGWVVGWLKSH